MRMKPVKESVLKPRSYVFVVEHLFEPIKKFVNENGLGRFGYEKGGVAGEFAWVFINGIQERFRDTTGDRDAYGYFYDNGTALLVTVGPDGKKQTKYTQRPMESWLNLVTWILEFFQNQLQAKLTPEVTTQLEKLALVVLSINKPAPTEVTEK